MTQAAILDTHEYRVPVAVSVVLHVLVVLGLSLNLSFCRPEVKLPPVPAHVKAVVVERSTLQPAPPAPEPPRPEIKKPEIKKPEIKKPEPPKPPPKPEPKKPIPKPEPKKAEPPKPKPEPKKAEPPKPEPKKPVVPDFDAMLDREDRSLAEDAAARKVAAEQEQREASARAAAEARVVADYKQKILDVLRHRWNRPPSARNGMSVTLSVNLIPGGEVVGMPVIVKSSGDAAFDRSAQNAVLLASPLPVPSDPVIFNANFRKFLFVARPEDLKQ